MSSSPPAAIPLPNDFRIRIEAIKVATNGNELLQCLRDLPTGRDSKAQGYSFNRFIKVLFREAKLPPDFSAQNYGSMKVGEKTVLHSSISNLTLEVHGKDLFEKLKDSILFSYDVLPVVANVAEVGESVFANRWAFMAEYMVHPAAREGLEAYHKKIPQEGKNLLLTDGMKAHRLSQVAALMKTCVEEVAPSVSNLFGEKWPALASIHPEKGSFADVDQFSALWTEAKNAFDILKANLDKSGSQESGEIADSTALEFCKYNQRTCKVNHFYLWLCWKEQDLNILSNTLSAGVATGGDDPATPYSRSAVPSANSTGSAVKQSYQDRKASKGQHLDKVAGVIAEVLKTSLHSLHPSTPEEQSKKRSAAYLEREAEQTLNLKLKRQREAIEAPSFGSLDVWLQDKMKASYANTLSQCNEL